MDKIIDKIVEWFNSILKDGIVNNILSLFDSVNGQVSWAAGEVGRTPQQYNPTVFNMVKGLSDNVIIPIAGLIIAFVCTYELLQMLVERNNMREFDIYTIIKWLLKTTATILIVTNTWNIVMSIFDVAQYITNSAAKVISTEATIPDAFVATLFAQLDLMSTGQLLGLLLESFICRLVILVVYVCVFIVVVGRMMEIYLMTSIAPIPMATFLQREGGPNMGRNYLRSLLALGFQAFLIMVCIGIYSALVHTIGSTSGDPSLQMLTMVGYTVLLCLALFKTGNLTKSIFNAH